MLPVALHDKIENQLDTTIDHVRRASGGSINQAGVLECANRHRYFLKWNHNAPGDMFQKEKMGLELLRNADTEIVIPQTYVQDCQGSTHYIIIEYLEEGRPEPESAEIFGRQLAGLHSTANNQFGLEHDNYIGRLPQSNTRHDDWITFFTDERLIPQVQMALDTGKLNSTDNEKFERLYHRLPNIMPDEKPALLHGDLWGGNFFYTTDGMPAIFDPAVYFGNREIELAFTHLFGGFAHDFYSSYEHLFPLEPGFHERKDIYNLYPLLVHVNMFGGTYIQQVRSIIRNF